MFIPPRLKDSISPSGARDPDSVIAAKQGLIAVGEYKPDRGEITGFPDSGMMAAIRRYQQKQGLFPDATMEKDGPTERVLRTDLMKRRGVMPERPLKAFPLQGTVRKGEVSVPGDAAVVDGTLRRLGYLHTTKPTEADRQGGLNRASLQLVNKTFAGMTYGDALHTRLAETAAMKDVDEGKVTSTFEDVREEALRPYGGMPLEATHDGLRFDQIAPTSAGFGQRELETSIEEALAILEGNTGFDPYAMVLGPPAGTPESWINQWKEELKPDPDPHNIGINSIGVAEPRPATNAVRLQILGISGHRRGVNHKDLPGILDDIARLPDLRPEQVQNLRQRIKVLDDPENKKDDFVVRKLNEVVDNTEAGELYPPMMTEDELGHDLERSRSAQEVAELVGEIAGLAKNVLSIVKKLKIATRLAGPVAVISVLLSVVKFGASVAHQIYTAREQRVILEFARRKVETLITEGHSA